MKKLLLASFAVIIGTTFIGALLANAEENGRVGRVEDHRSVGSTLEVHINNSGKVLVRGAQVTGVSGSVITANTLFGGYTMAWTVKTDANTQFIRKHGGASSVAEVTVGDIVSFSGMFDTTAVTPTVNATIFKDWSIQKIDQVVSGTVKSVDTTAQSFVLGTERKGDVNVQANANTVITSKATTTTFSAITVGANVKAIGIWSNATKILTATKIRVRVNEE